MKKNKLQNEPTDAAEEEAFISKSQVKRELKAIRKLGTRLTTLNDSQLRKLLLSDKLRAAVEESRRIGSFNARKRHISYIAKLLRDEQIEIIEDFFRHLDGLHSEKTAIFHQLECWRDRMIENDHCAITEFVTAYPQANRQHLNQLVRNAIKEKAAEKPPAASRKLFRYLREVSDNPN